MFFFCTSKLCMHNPSRKTGSAHSILKILPLLDSVKDDTQPLPFVIIPDGPHELLLTVSTGSMASLHFRTATRIFRGQICRKPLHRGQHFPSIL